LSPSQKTFHPPWGPKLVTGLPQDIAAGYISDAAHFP